MGPVLARVISDPTFYKNADTDAKVAVEKAIAEEKLEMFKTDLTTVVSKGPPPLHLLDHGTTVPKERTALWHVLYKDDDDNAIKVVYVYAHFETEEKEGAESNMAALLGVLRDEFELAEKEGRLRGRRAFGIAQAGTGLSFFEYDGGDVSVVVKGKK